MTFPAHIQREALTTMADGTIKQVNPFSGTQVWTVPGRGNRPLSAPVSTPHQLKPGEGTHACAFCAARLLDTPPEKSRIVHKGSDWEIQRNLLPDELLSSQAEFRRVPNLFEIVSYDYWSKNYGYEMPPDRREHMNSYLADPAGRKHVLDIVRTRLKASGANPDLPEDDLLHHAPAYFGGGHDVIIARRHFVDGATDSSQLASSGTLSPEQHYGFITLTIDSLRDLYDRNPHVPYVSVFQNWLAPAGASFDHLHKQLVAIDEHGVQTDMEIAALHENPNAYNDWGVTYAADHGLVIAENDTALLVAGVGHRYPTMEVYSKASATEPWELDRDEMRGFSDLLHAAHAATGPEIACNEEWHHKPVDIDNPMPLRVDLKWRVSTLAGFEGGTHIYVNTLSPRDVRDRVINALLRLRDKGGLAANIRIGYECTPARNALRYLS